MRKRKKPDLDRIRKLLERPLVERPARPRVVATRDDVISRSMAPNSVSLGAEELDRPVAILIALEMPPGTDSCEAAQTWQSGGQASRIINAA